MGQQSWSPVHRSHRSRCQQAAHAGRMLRALGQVRPVRVDRSRGRGPPDQRSVRAVPRIPGDSSGGPTLTPRGASRDPPESQAVASDQPDRLTHPQRHVHQQVLGFGIAEQHLHRPPSHLFVGEAAVVSPGRRYEAITSSSKEAMDRSSGTRNPCSAKAWYAPKASWSLSEINPVGRTSEASRSVWTGPAGWSSSARSNPDGGFVPPRGLEGPGTKGDGVDFRPRFGLGT